MIATTHLILGMGYRYTQVLRSQYWSEKRSRAHLHHCLEKTLAATADIPFYGNRFSHAPSLDAFHSLPVLNRSDIAELNRSVRSLYPETKRFKADRSSGSTGMPTEFLFDSSHQRGRFAARTRYLTQNGWHPLKRTAWIIPLPKDTPDGRLMKRRKMLGSRFLSIFTPAEDQLAWLSSFNPHFIYSLPSNLEVLADAVNAEQLKLPALQKVFTGGEVLEETHRRKVMNALGVEISDNYGSTEGFCAWQCPKGAYHINTEHLILEILDEHGRPVPAGQTGQIVITTLENYLMPLVRYAIGDYGALSGDIPCECGRTLPLLDSIKGRTINLFRLPGGRVVSPWEIVVKLKYIPGMKQFQIIQKDLDQYIFRISAAYPLTDEKKSEISDVFRHVVGLNAVINFERVEAIRREASGKFMTAISEVGQ